MTEGDTGSLSPRGRDAHLALHEEQLVVGKTTRDAGRLGVRKRVETTEVAEDIPRRVEHPGDLERVPAREGDSGEIETLPDGSVSIPLLEEELVVTKRTVVRERIVVRRRTETQRQRVDAELRRERVELDVEEGLEVVDERDAEPKEE